MLQKQRGGGLAVGAGDTDHLHGCGRISEEITADIGQCQPVGLHQHIGDLRFRLSGGNNDSRTFFHGHGNKTVAVCGKAGDGHKHPAGLYLSGVVGHMDNLCFHIRSGFQNSNVCKQFFQFHSISPSVTD